MSVNCFQDQIILPVNGRVLCYDEQHQRALRGHGQSSVGSACQWASLTGRADLRESLTGGACAQESLMGGSAPRVSSTGGAGKIHLRAHLFQWVLAPAKQGPARGQRWTQSPVLAKGAKGHWISCPKQAPTQHEGEQGEKAASSPLSAEP